MVKMAIEELLVEALVPEEEQPYKLPNNWVWSKLGIIGEYLNGRGFKKQEWSDNGRPIIRIQDLTGTNNNPNFFEGEVETRYEIKRGDFLISWSATLGAYIWNGPDAVLNQHIFKVNSYINKMFHYYLVSEIIHELYARTHGSGMVHVTKGIFDSTKIPLPPLNEQQRIVALIESLFKKLDRAKELAQAALDSFENRKSAILHKAFTGELTRKWREESGVDSERDWEEKELGDLIKDGPQNGLYKPQTAYGSGFLIIRIDSFYDGKINPWNTLKKLKLEKNEIDLYGLKNNDILVNRVNSIQYLGKSALVRNLQETCVFESNVMRMTLKNDANPEYVIRYLNSDKGLGELRKNAKHAVNQASINQTDVKNVLISMPTIKEQQEIVHILDNLLENEQKAKELCDVIDKIDHMKKSILARTFRGELSTNNPAEESALELLKEVLLEKV